MKYFVKIMVFEFFFTRIYKMSKNLNFFHKEKPKKLLWKSGLQLWEPCQKFLVIFLFIRSKTEETSRVYCFLQKILYQKITRETKNAVVTIQWKRRLEGKVFSNFQVSPNAI